MCFPINEGSGAQQGWASAQVDSPTCLCKRASDDHRQVHKAKLRDGRMVAVKARRRRHAILHSCPSHAQQQQQGPAYGAW